MWFVNTRNTAIKIKTQINMPAYNNIINKTLTNEI